MLVRGLSIDTILKRSRITEILVTELGRCNTDTSRVSSVDSIDTRHGVLKSLRIITVVPTF